MINYSTDIKHDRMKVVRDALVGGRIELLQDKYLLARVPLGDGKVEDDLLTFGVSEGIATDSGRPTDGRFIDYYGNVVADGLVVGIDIDLDGDRVEVGQTVRIISATVRHG